MHMAVALDYDAWITKNTAICRRLSARITVIVCRHNRLISAVGHGDSHCAECGGLFNQPEPGINVKPVLTAIAGGFLSSVEDPMSRALVEALQEILVGEPTGDLDALDLDDLEPEQRELPLAITGTAKLDPLTRLLMSELQRQDEEDMPEPVRVEILEPREQTRRVRVYVGRCEKCAGYMIRAPKECRDGIIDDEVYRCFNCGWRTSPGYDYNREHPGGGWR